MPELFPLAPMRRSRPTSGPRQRIAGLILGLGLAAPVAAAPPAPDPAANFAATLPAVSHESRREQKTLPEWMRALNVPGVSIAVIDDYRIAWTGSWGVTTPEAGGQPVTAGTRFQAASIAKALTAVAVLRQSGDAGWRLDADINSTLKRWQLPRSEAQGEAAVTLRQLLSHTGGVTPGGFAGYPRGQALPGLVAILAGEAPAESPAARVLSAPGGEAAYSGLGYQLLQLALEDREGRDFNALMTETVLAPMGMAHSGFWADLPETLAHDAAHGHFGPHATPVEGGWRAHPELAAAGLWSTPSDLARFAIDVAEAYRGSAGRRLTPAQARTLLTPQAEGMGLGVVVRGEGSQGYFAHSGGNRGYFAHVEMLADSGDGVALMINAEAGQALASLLIAAVAREQAWPLTDRAQLTPGRAQRLFAAVDAARAPKRVVVAVPAEVLANYVGRYQLAPDMQFDITLADGVLQLRLADQPRFPLLPESPTRFFVEAVDAQVSFVPGPDGRARALVLHQGGRDQTAPRVD